ncbi:hypothetical protein J3Q64DRAFT_1728854 [Phycomyces blakesleeanus]|uniref:Uncharacterized protein n=1 Tax=Phycomyces blakesleeanus TaxID=4837 RepID=A0ABR3B8E3_PHYBL
MKRFSDNSNPSLNSKRHCKSDGSTSNSTSTSTPTPAPAPSSTLNTTTNTTAPTTPTTPVPTDDTNNPPLSQDSAMPVNSTETTNQPTCAGPTVTNSSQDNQETHQETHQETSQETKLAQEEQGKNKEKESKEEKEKDDNEESKLKEAESHTNTMTASILNYIKSMVESMEQRDIEACLKSRLTKETLDTLDPVHVEMATFLDSTLKQIAQRQLDLETENLRYRIAIQQQHQMLTSHYDPEEDTDPPPPDLNRQETHDNNATSEEGISTVQNTSMLEQMQSSYNQLLTLPTTSPGIGYFGKLKSPPTKTN